MWTGDQARFRSALGGAPARFIVAGIINTALTLALYLVLLVYVEHSIAYSAAFVCGIGLSYVLSRSYVFRSVGGVSTMVLFPLVYLAQYFTGLVVVLMWVDVLRLPPGLASIAAVIVTLPVTYGLSRWVFLRRDRPRQGSARTDTALTPPTGADSSSRHKGGLP